MHECLASVIAGLVVLAAVASPARAINYAWAGSATPSDWRDSTKWNPNVGYPGSAPGDSAGFPQTSNANVTLRGALSVDGILMQSSNVFLTLEGTSVDGPVSLTATTFPAHSGEIRLTSTGGPAGATLTVTGGGTFFNIGTLFLLPGAGGARTVDVGSVINDGGIQVQTNARVGRVGSGFLWNGTGSVGIVSVAVGATLTTNQYLQQGSNPTTALYGTLDVASGPVEFTGGRLLGNGTLTDALTTVNTRIQPRTGPNAVTESTLSVLDDVTFGNNTQLDVLLGDAAETSLLAVTGDLNLTGTGTTLTFTGGVAGETYTVVTYTSVRTGTFSASTPGYTVSYSTPGEIRVTPVPEPGAAALLCGFAIPLLSRRRAFG